MNHKIIFFSLLMVILTNLNLFGQSQEGLIQLEIKNYVSIWSQGLVESEGETVDDLRVGEWTYYLMYDRNIKVYQGNYVKGKKSGIWNNYALLPPMGYSNNYDLVRSSEAWKGDKLYRLKMGQDNLLITINSGLEEPYVTELRRLDEAFEHSYRRTHGKTITPEFGESVESILARIIPFIRDELIKSKATAELKFWNLYGKLRLHETYDSGVVTSKQIQKWEKDVLFSKEVYEHDVLKEKFLYMGGNPDDVIVYSYYPDGKTEFMKHYKNDTLPVGRWIEYYPDGGRKSQGDYQNGKRDGKWKFWDEAGTQTLIKYNNGIPQ